MRWTVLLYHATSYSVNIKRLEIGEKVVENTIEERVLEIIYQKQQLFTAMFDTDIDETNLAARSQVKEMQQLGASLLGERTGE
jgi:hypothetical protein